VGVVLGSVSDHIFIKYLNKNVLGIKFRKTHGSVRGSAQTAAHFNFLIFVEFLHC
jgi:hypothetical protein